MKPLVSICRRFTDSYKFITNRKACKYDKGSDKKRISIFYSFLPCYSSCLRRLGKAVLSLTCFVEMSIGIKERGDNSFELSPLCRVCYLLVGRLQCAGAKRCAGLIIYRRIFNTSLPQRMI